MARAKQNVDPLITLLTDFGERDVFSGVMKGVIATINPRAHVIDLSHGVTAFDAHEAALMLRDTFRFFPKGAVHVVVVDPGVGGSRRILAAAACDHFFIAPDTGILGPVLEGDPRARVVNVTNRDYFLPRVSHTFHGRDIFSPVAAHLSLGVALESFGPVVNDVHRLTLPEPRRSRKDTLAGEVVRIDRFGNLITNIPATALGPCKEWASLIVAIAGKEIRGVSCSYDAVPEGALVAVLGSFGTLEIGRNRASARDCLGAERGLAVTLRRVNAGDGANEES